MASLARCEGSVCMQATRHELKPPLVRPWTKVQGETAKMIINWILILQDSQSTGENKTMGQVDCANNHVKNYSNSGV